MPMTDETRIFLLGFAAGTLFATEGAILFVWAVYL